MRIQSRVVSLAAGLAATALATSASAAAFSFSTGSPDGRIATLSRPAGPGLETETADDFVLGGATQLTSATFTGLLPTNGASVTGVTVEIYRTFPNDSTVPPSGQVPTRANSPSDVVFDSRDSAGGSLSFSTTTLASTFTASNSVVNGINPLPNQTTGGEGAVTGEEVLFNINFTNPFILPGDHYFFVPLVSLSSGQFLWLSAPRPIVAPGTPFAPDLQAWIRNDNLAPDWLRVGTDIVGSGAFNMAFSLDGADVAVPEPATWALMIGGFGMAGAVLRRRRSRVAA
jgi:hypothetical protein